MSLWLRLPAGCVQRCRICDRPPHNSRRVRNAQIFFARSKKGKKKEQNRAEPFGGFFRCPRRVPPPQQQPGANVLLGVLWPADRGVVLKVCEGRKEEKKGRHTSILTNFALDSSSFRERISRGENPGLVATWVFRVSATVSESENCSQANSTKQKK